MRNSQGVACFDGPGIYYTVSDSDACPSTSLAKSRVVSMLFFHYPHIISMGGCQNYGPVLDPYHNTAPNT